VDLSETSAPDEAGFQQDFFFFLSNLPGNHLAFFRNLCKIEQNWTIPYN
jgi:hypothetical protein